MASREAEFQQSIRSSSFPKTAGCRGTVSQKKRHRQQQPQQKTKTKTKDKKKTQALLTLAHDAEMTSSYKGWSTQMIGGMAEDLEAMACVSFCPCIVFGRNAKNITDGHMSFFRFRSFFLLLQSSHSIFSVVRSFSSAFAPLGLATVLSRNGACSFYALVGGCWAAPLCFVCGPLAYWITFIPCLGAKYRHKLRAKRGLPEVPLSDKQAHCLCHPCALCQESREIASWHSDVVIGPSKPNVDRGPEETIKYLESFQEMKR